MKKIWLVILVLSTLATAANLRGPLPNVAFALVGLAVTAGLGLLAMRQARLMEKAAEARSHKLSEIASDSRFLSFNASIAAARASSPAGREFENLARELERFSHTCRQAASGLDTPTPPPPFRVGSDSKVH